MEETGRGDGARRGGAIVSGTREKEVGAEEETSPAAMTAEKRGGRRGRRQSGRVAILVRVLASRQRRENWKKKRRRATESQVTKLSTATAETVEKWARPCVQVH